MYTCESLSSFQLGSSRISLSSSRLLRRPFFLLYISPSPLLAALGLGDPSNLQGQLSLRYEDESAALEVEDLQSQPRSLESPSVKLTNYSAAVDSDAVESGVCHVV